MGENHDAAISINTQTAIMNNPINELSSINQKYRQSQKDEKVTIPKKPDIFGNIFEFWLQALQ
jgi:hypothetical protein